MKAPGYILKPCSGALVAAMCEHYHYYGGAGCGMAASFAVFEDGEAVAAFAWSPPPYGAAEAVCLEAPQGVLALSRMVAVPRAERRLNHISKPLRRQMRVLLDRGRWPVLVTYHDEGEGHTGHVYKCSGWQPTVRNRVPVFQGPDGVRKSKYSGGRRSDAKHCGWTWLQRWEHWACERGRALEHMEAEGWRRVPIPGKKWASGNQAYTYKKERREE